MSIKLTYFNIQGAAEKIRLALALKGIPFEDERLNKDQWNALKVSIPLQSRRPWPLRHQL
jgi:hypothetical protein